jgi:hypothetical protein
VDVNQGEVDALVLRGYLSEDQRGDVDSIKKAIEVVLSDMAFELQSETAATRVTGAAPAVASETVHSLHKGGIGGGLGWKAQFTDDEKKLALLRRIALSRIDFQR